VVSRLDDANLLDPARQWLFEVVFDYGEHSAVPPSTTVSGKWLCRKDPFSSYRAGFEVRCYRLCQRVLMFHRFAELADKRAVGKVPPYLVRSTDFTHSDDTDAASDKQRGGLRATFLQSVTQTGHTRKEHGTHFSRALPPLEFAYSPATIDPTVRELDQQSIQNVPQGLDGQIYQWVDLESEGLSGVLTEQADGWFYKRNLSPINRFEEDGVARAQATLAPLERVASRPNPNIAAAQTQWMDLEGEGQLELVMLEGLTPGFYQHDDDASWKPFRPFVARANRDMRDPNLRLVDLDGDGRADVLVTEDDVLTWYPSRGEEGFAAALHVAKPQDDDAGPALVFADGTQSIYLADMSGDGLSDLVRIRNGSICYWPNLGYGLFGAKITMDNAPWFDTPDLFDQRRIRLTDIDGSGTADIVYLKRDCAQLFFNQSGNQWSAPSTLEGLAAGDRFSAVMAADLLGIGTSCLVWSSPLPGAARAPMKYIDLMSGQKPHLLVEVNNNRGAITTVDYVPSTRFYLEDERAGTPWVTRLPFPVQCVARVTFTDNWRAASFTSTYSYHHGFYDRVEKEFRGFGRVEQVDCESYGIFAAANKASPYVVDRSLFQPPVKTVTWYHTGAFFDRARILSQFEGEYFPNWFDLGGFHEDELPEPDLRALDLTTDEWREALRACKGMVLRQEIYELDVAKLEQGVHLPVKLFSVAQRNCDIRRLQPIGSNRHAVFLTLESEAITYHYELDLRPGAGATADPRVSHTLNLRFDHFGRPLQSVVAAYARFAAFDDTSKSLSADQVARIRDVQNEQHLGYAETHFTKPLSPDPDNHRLPAVCEALSYELTGFLKQGRYFTLAELRAYKLSDTLPDQGSKAVGDVDYQKQPPSEAQRRLVERHVTLYFKDDLSGPDDFGNPSRLGLTYETYKLALTADLLGDVLQDKFTATVRGELGTATKPTDFLASGYLPDSALFATGKTAQQWWMRSGVAGFAAGAAQRFYLPERYTDPFGKVTTLSYDGEAATDPTRRYLLFVASSTDAVGNTVAVEAFDYRVLAPARIKDANDNESAAAFDALGFPVATALIGKPGIDETGDTLDGFTVDLLDPDDAAIAAFFGANSFDGRQARRWLGKATARFVYHFGGTTNALGACSIMREQHERDAPNVDNADPTKAIPIQVSVEYSDGSGNVLVKKVQAEPDVFHTGSDVLRWIASGKTVVNNKGKPIKQYEPYPSGTAHQFQPAEAQSGVGVTLVLSYDAAGRLIRTDMPDGSFSRIEFSPWFVRSYDQNDTLADGNPWYDARKILPAGDPDQRAAELAKTICGDTPAETHLDSLGRDVVAIAHNRTRSVDSAGPDVLTDERFDTFTKLDAEGKPLWIRDARGNLVMQYIASTTPGVSPAKATRWANDSTETMPTKAVTAYDIAGNLMFQHSMDAGDRWMIMDGAGQPLLAWDQNQSSAGVLETRLYTTRYDALHRPVSLQLAVGGATPVLIEQFVYSDTTGSADLAGAKKANLIGKLVQHYDSSGLRQLTRCDWSGNVAEEQRNFVKAFDASVTDWSSSPAPAMATDTFTQTSEYDALNRITRHTDWHRQNGPKLAIYQPAYNERGALLSETLTIRDVSSGSETPAAAIKDIRYNVKGQKERMTLGNGTVTHYDYDPVTFRLRELRTTRPNYDPPFPSDRAALLADPSVLQQLRYTYDPVGNIAAIEDGAFKPVYFQNSQVDPRNQYEYDALYRLTYASGRESAQGGEASGGNALDPAYASGFPITDQTLRQYIQHYSYDAAGNFLTMRHIVPTDTARNWTRSYTPAADSNRLAATVIGSATATNSNYDTHGNMLNLFRTVSGSDTSFAFQWDHRDMIASINLVGGGIAFYQYGADKQRTRKYIKRNGTKTEERLYLGGCELYRRYSGTTLVEEIETHHLLEGDNRVLMVDDVLTASTTGTTRPDGLGVPKQTLFRYQYSNHLGSACLELDSQAAIISYEEYHPYGTSAYRATPSGAEAPPKRYRYTGMERDEESGLSYHTARYYAPWLGRWVSCDPAGIADSYSVFIYAHDNPLNLTDHTGRNGDTVDEKVKPNENVRYNESLKGRVEGVNPQKDHVLSQGKQKIVNPKADASKQLTVVAETGAAKGGEPAKPHTWATFLDPQADTKEIRRLRLLQPKDWAKTSFEAEIITPSLQSRYRAGYDVNATNKALLDEVGSLFEINQPNRKKGTPELELDWETKLAPDPWVASKLAKSRGGSGRGGGGGGAAAGRTTVPMTLSLFGLSLTAIAAVQTYNKVKGAYEVSRGEGDKEILRQTAAWGFGMGSQMMLATTLAEAGLFTGGPGGAAAGFLIGLAVGTVASTLGYNLMDESITAAERIDDSDFDWLRPFMPPPNWLAPSATP